MGLSLAIKGSSCSLRVRSFVKFFSSSHVQQIRKSSNKITTLMADLGASLVTHAQVSLTILAVDVEDMRSMIHVVMRWLECKISEGIIKDWSYDNFKTEAMEEAELKEIEKDFRDAEVAQRAKWEAFQMVKAMGKSTEEKLHKLGENLQLLHKDVSLLKDLVQGISTASLHMMHDLAHLRCRLGNCGHKLIRESTCTSNSRTSKFGRDDNATD
eukprot:Gb_15341 [translate_table: standard]